MPGLESRLGSFVTVFCARAAAITLSLTLLWSQARAAESPPAVLIIHSNQRPTPAAIVIEDTLRATVPAQFKQPVDLYSEYLDTEVPSSAELAAEQLEFLAHKYEARNVRIIVASAPGAVPFAVRLRKRMAIEVPIVHVAIPRDTLAAAKFPSDVVGKPVDLDPTPTIKLALRLHPGVTQVVVVVGATERDRVWERRVRAAAGHFVEGPDFQYVTGLTTAEVLRRVGALPHSAIVYTPGYFTDGAGETVTPRRAVERIAMASAVPVYGALDTFLGSGIVGGAMTPYDAQARQAGAIVARLLNGATPAQIDTSPVPQVPMVDWRQVRRWGIDERLLPPGTIVEFREPSAWERYGVEISIGVGIVVLQAILIGALLLGRRSRLRTASALAETEKQMKLAASAAQLSSWVWGTVRDMRPTTASKDAPIPLERVLASVHPADRGNVEREVSASIATGRELNIEYRVVEPDGGVRWLAARGRPEAGGERLHGVALDVTERKLTELRAAEDRSALRQMGRVSMMGQLSAAIAHQLFQPLAAILGNAETAQKMLSRDKLDVAELEEICKDIVSEDRRATEVIRRLSQLYKRDRRESKPIDLNELVRETLDLLRTEFVVRHVVPQVEPAADLPKVDGDTVQLQQVILNLVLNAADAMSDTTEERRLTIRTEARGKEVRTFVVDNGPGISQDHLDAVFDPFWTTKFGGMGMGLAICRSIIAAHNGSITASNNAEGGATFCVSLPVGSSTRS